VHPEAPVMFRKSSQEGFFIGEIPAD